MTAVTPYEQLQQTRARAQALLNHPLRPRQMAELADLLTDATRLEAQLTDAERQHDLWAGLLALGRRLRRPDG
jgi:hypothetical protein